MIFHELHAVRKVGSGIHRASLARSEAQIAAGQAVPLEPVLDRLRASIARMQADEKPETPSPAA